MNNLLYSIPERVDLRYSNGICCLFIKHVVSVYTCLHSIPRADTLDVCCWFWLQFRTRHPWKPRNWHQNYGGILSPLLALKIFLESFYTGMKVRSWLKSHTFQSALHMLNVDHLNIDGPPFPVKCVRKFGSTLGGAVTYKVVCEQCKVVQFIMVHLTRMETARLSVYIVTCGWKVIILNNYFIV